MKSSVRISVILASFLATAGLVGCNSSTSALEDDKKKSTQAAAQAEASAQASGDGAAQGESTLAAEGTAEEKNQVELAKVINKPGKVKNRGGYIKLLVNRQPITNFDIQRRTKFLQLRRVGGNRTKVAEKEMIEQAVKLQEAKFRRVMANDKMVNEAFASFAKRNRTSTSNMTKELNRLGVGADHFKEFIRTQISWQRVVQGKFQAETNQLSERDVVTQLRKSGSAKPEVTEYNLQQIIFVVPEAKRSKSLLNARKVEASSLRQRFTSCPETINLAKVLKDVSVVDRKRIMEPELPEAWAKEVVGLNKNDTTRPRETSRGVEVMAVCDKRVVSDDRAAQITSQSGEFESFNEKGSQLGEEYLKELVSKATVIYQ